MSKTISKSHSGSGHWLLQRATALALIPFTIWLVSVVLLAFVGKRELLDILENPFNAIMVITFMLFALYHGALGLQVVIEDYINRKFVRMIVLAGVKIFTIFTAIAFIFSVVYFYSGK